MECNKDEALKAIAVSEYLFEKRDIVGAKKLALEAQTLYPSLDGISQMIATLNVHLSAEKVVNGERDWYAILSLSASADDEAVKKQYRKLALVLHPDKNKSVGAEGAFKLISEAWSILSDRNKRTTYDQKRNFGMYRHTTSQPYYSSNGFCHFGNTSILRTKKRGSGVHKDPSAKSAAQCQVPSVDPSCKASGGHEDPGPSTFWTSCSRCKMRYEYLRIYINHRLLCPNCHELFLATEIANPKDHHSHQSTSNSSKNTHKYGKYHHGASGKSFQYFKSLDSNRASSFHWGAFSSTAGAASAAASSCAAAQAANMVHKAYEKVRRERKEKQAAVRRENSVGKRSHASKHTTNSMHFGCLDGFFDATTFDSKHSSRGFSFGMDHSLKRKRANNVDVKNNRRHGRDGYEAKNGMLDLDSKMSFCFGVSSDDCREVDRQSTRSIKGFSLLDVREMLVAKAKTLVQKNLDHQS